MKVKGIEEDKIFDGHLATNQALINAMPDLVFILDKNGIYLAHNSENNNDLYKAPDEFLAKSVDEVLPPDLARRSLRYIKRALKSRRVEIFEYQLEINGALHDYECHMNAIDDSSVIAIVKDITEKRLEAEKFRNLIEAVPDPLIMIKQDGCIVFVNEQAIKHFGYLRKELIGKNFEILIPERFMRAHFQHVREYFLKPQVRPMGSGLELFAVRKDGSEFPVEISLSPFHAKDGMMVIAAIRDITERKQAEEELIKYRDHLEDVVAEQKKELKYEITENKRVGKELIRTQKYLDTILLNMPAGLAILEGPEFIYTKINQELANINGLNREEHLGRPLVEVLPQAAKDIVPLLQKVLDSGEATPRREFSTRLPKDPDEIRHFSDSFFPIKGQDDKVMAVGVVVLDMGKHVRVEEALKASERTALALLNAPTDLALLLELDGTIVAANEASNRTWGRRPKELIGVCVYDLMPPDVAKSRKAYNEQVISLGKPVRFQDQREGRSFDNHVYPVFDAENKVYQLAVYACEFTELKQAQDEMTYLREEIRSENNFHEIIGKSDALLYVLNRVSSIAATDTTTLILGETGTGKELFARAIHERSRRKDAVFIKLNCSTLQRDLIESELFGHEKGAFTGAIGLRRGRFELANGGTIFLDEIGEIPLDLQSKLLRVLQEGEFQRVGGEQTLKIDVRVIAATNRDLNREIREGRFRQDLFYRLDVFPITVPPLRDRIDDMVILTEYFINKFSKKLGKHVDRISSKSLQELKNYHWPGNIRELENIIERAMVVSTGSELRLADNLSSNGKMVEDVLYTEQTLEEVERKYIIQILKKKNWRIEGDAGAAMILGMHPSTLRNRLLKLKIART